MAHFIKLFAIYYIDKPLPTINGLACREGRRVGLLPLTACVITGR